MLKCRRISKISIKMKNFKTFYKVQTVSCIYTKEKISKLKADMWSLIIRLKAFCYQKPFIRFWSTCAALTTFTVRLSLYLVLKHTIQSFKHSIELFETETWLSFCFKSYSRDDFLALRQSQQHLESSTAYLDYNTAHAVETNHCKKSCF